MNSLLLAIPLVFAAHPALAQSAAIFRAEPDYTYEYIDSNERQAEADRLWAGFSATIAADTDVELAPETLVAIERREVIAAMQAQTAAVVACRERIEEAGGDPFQAQECSVLSRGSARLRGFYSRAKEVLEQAAMGASKGAATLEAARTIAPVALRLELTQRLENIQRAEALRRREVAIYEEVGGEVPWESIAAYFRLSDNLRVQREYAEAENLLAKAAALADATWDFDAAVKGDLALQRAELYADMRRPARAETQALKARRILAEWFEPYEQLPLEAEAAYARALLNANRLQEAADVLDALENAIGARMNLPFEPVAIRLSLQRAELNQRRGEPSRAEAIYRDIVARGVGLGVKDDPLVALALKRLAGTLAQTGRFAEAAPAFDEALATLVATVGKPHPETADALLGYGRLFERQGEFSRARDLYETALSYLGPFAIGIDHATIAGRRAAALAQLTVSPERKDAAFELALATFAKALGDDPHPARALALHEWGAALWRRPSATRDGRELMREARAMFAQVADSTNLARIETLGEYAALLPRSNAAEAYSAIAQASDGALARIGSYEDFGASAQGELQRLAPVFLTRAKLAWKIYDAR